MTAQESDSVKVEEEQDLEEHGEEMGVQVWDVRCLQMDDIIWFIRARQKVEEGE